MCYTDRVNKDILTKIMLFIFHKSVLADEAIYKFRVIAGTPIPLHIIHNLPEFKSFRISGLLRAVVYMHNYSFKVSSLKVKIWILESGCVGVGLLEHSRCYLNMN